MNARLFSYLLIISTFIFTWWLGPIYLFPALFGVFLLRLIYETFQFPKREINYYLLAPLIEKYKYLNETLSRENLSLSSELKEKKIEVQQLKNQQQKILLSSDEKLFEAEYLLKKQKRQKRLLDFIGHDLKAPFQNILTYCCNGFVIINDV